MSTTFGILIGGFGMFLFFFALGAIVFIMHILNRQKYNRRVRVTNWNAGRPYVELYWARLIKHDTLGDV